MTSFNDLFIDRNVPASVTRALAAMNFTAPTPIQAQAIPLAFTGQDLIGCAQTGTGKTAAFSIPTLVHLMRTPGRTALVLVPTRELASQIEMFWRNLVKFTPQMECVVLIGGMPMYGQLKALQRRPRLYIATPGRLVDHLQRGSVKLDNVDVLILDEADRMLDMGFAPQLSQILRYVPQKRQTLFFSATWAPTVDGLSAKYLKNPVRVSVDSNEAAPKIKQTTLETTIKDKNNLLLDELNAREGSVLVFTRTQVRTDRVAKFLASYGMEVARIHGGRTQGQRTAALNGSRSGKSRILIATDIAARGIDVTGIGHVINYDLPQLPEDYIHRIGRTGRAGLEGEALSLVTPEDRLLWRAIERLLHKKEFGSTEERRSAGRPQRAPIREPRSPRAHGQVKGPGQRPQPNRDRGRPQPPGQGAGQGQRQARGRDRSQNQGPDRRDQRAAQVPAVKPLFGIIG